MKRETVYCARCGEECKPTGCTTGYGTVPGTGEKHCFKCCAEIDRADMAETGKATLYLVDPGKPGCAVTNWPGTLRFRVVHLRTGRHNIARTRYDVWFRGPEGKEWHGVQYGEDTQIVHCRRLKG